MSDPFGDALAAQSQDNAAPDPFGTALVAHVAGGDVSEPTSSLWDKYVGFQESQLAGLTGGVAGMAGGMSYLGNLVLGKSSDEAKSASEALAGALTYSPRTAEGKKQTADMSAAAANLGQNQGAEWGEKTADATGSPLLGAAVNTALNIPQFLIGAKGGEKLGEGLSEPAPTKLTQQQEVLVEAQKHGLVVPPSTTNPTLFNKAVEGTAGNFQRPKPRQLKTNRSLIIWRKPRWGLGTKMI